MMDDITKRTVMLAAIVDSSDDAIISKDLNSIITSWNRGAELIFGYTEQEVLGKHIQILIPEDRLHEEEMIISRLKQGRKIEHYETIRVTKTGRLVNVSLTVSPIMDSDGTTVGASKIARDITRQKQQEELIMQYSNRLEMIISVGKTISSELDIDSVLQKVTDATTQLCGAAFGAFFYNKTDERGNSYMLYTLSGAPREAFEKFPMPRSTDVFKTTFDGEGIFRSDDITKDPKYGKNSPYHGMPAGHLPVVSYLAVPVYSKKGLVIGGLFFGHPKAGVFKEEHEHLVDAIAIQASIALTNAQVYQEVSALNLKKDEFIGFASHEVKTPITTISGYLQLAKQRPELAPGFFEKMEKQIFRLQNIINDLLDISKIQAGRLDLNFEPSTVQSLIRESIDAVATPGRKIEAECPKEDVMINIDHQKMSQVVVNLLSNAIKYSPVDSPIFVRAIRLGDQINISVKDSGVGISAEHVANIFTQFYRITNSHNVQGIGLGLYIAKEIVEAHHGKISVESKEGEGSVFCVEFPMERRG
ncbi:MAG: PAS domain S-box protein [Chitinophagaceae bacterium]|nr:PAS domain S-box protein [Chitinophagaceae bacterium]